MKKFYFFFILIGLYFSGTAQTTTFTTVGGPYTYTVPAGGQNLAVDVIGGKGGDASASAPYGVGGKGGRVQCTLAVSGGQVLYIFVGGKSANGTTSCCTITTSGGVNGGGDAQYYIAGPGGGASDIRTGSGAYTSSLTTRLVVAGGGGGAGYGYCCTANYNNGGDGGGPTGATGWMGNSQSYSGTYYYTGGGGGQSSGGQNGTAGSCGQTAGALGVGGKGPTCVYGGGGGGGYYGGGGAYEGGGGGGSSFADPSKTTGVTHTQGYSSTDGSVSITVLCTTPGTISGTLSTCVGATTTLSDLAAPGAGTWQSSNSSVAMIDPSTGIVTGITPGTVTITYQESFPCGGVSATAVFTVNPTPSPLPATSTYCQYANNTLTDTAAGGIWTSSNGSVASVSPSGVVSSVTPGSTTITYRLPAGCATSTNATVLSAPAVYPVTPTTGGGAICVGSATGIPIGLLGSDLGKTYQLIFSGSTITSTAGTGGALNFGSFTFAGAYTVVGRDNITGCQNAMTGSVTVTVNPNPAAISGAFATCVGSSATLTNPTSGGTWSISNPTQGNINAGTGIITGISAGTPIVTYTLSSTGCYATSSFIINPLPGPISGSLNVCVGANSSLVDAATGGTWISSAPGTAMVSAGGGVLTGVNPGSATLTYTLGTGCSITGNVLVNPPPTPYALTGGGNYCQGSGGVHIGLAYANSGINYQLFDGITPMGAPVAGSNAGLDFGAQTAAGTYSVVASNPLTGCINNMTGTLPVVLNPLPNPSFNVTGGGNYCIGTSGVNIGLDGSEIGVRYQLNNGGPVGTAINGTTSPLNFGVFSTAGTYSIIGTYVSTGCANTMSGNALVNISPLPTAYIVSSTNGGHYCAGGSGASVIINNSDPGTVYQVYRSGIAAGSAVLSTTGGPLFFGPFSVPGVYTVKGTSGSTGCTGNMSGSVTIIVDPLPTPYAVTGGGGYCADAAGLHVGLIYSSIGVDYQLWYSGGLINTLHGSGSGLDYGIQSGTGTYSVIAVNSTTGCSSGMSGSATIGVNPLPPVYDVTVTGSNSYCLGGAGVSLGTNMSDVGTNYQLYRGTTMSGAAVSGVGGPLSFGLVTTPGTYSVRAVNAVTGCAIAQNGTQTVAVNPLPSVYTVSGGGNYCLGGIGLPIMLSNSVLGVTYELYKNGNGTAVLQFGTGSSLNFGLITDAGIYTVVATDDNFGCRKNMSGSATIGVYSLPTQFNVTGSGTTCAGGAGVHIGLSGTSTGVRYQLYGTSGPVGSAMSGTGGMLDFGGLTIGDTYSVVATSVLTGCTNPMSGTASVIVNPLPTSYVVTGGGSICATDPGVDISIPMSDGTVNYTLVRGSTVVAGPLAGTGGVLDFGLYNIAGVYSIMGEDAVTGCRKNMAGTAIVNIVAPAVYSVTGGGGFCVGDPGVHVGQGGSSLSASYQLYIDGGAFGIPVPGTGSALDFGIQTTGGVYTIRATDNTYGCGSNMGGSATVVANPLPLAFNLTGSGSYCSGDAGLPLDLSSSSMGVNYQLMRGTASVGSLVAGSGGAIHFGFQTTAGSYTVMAHSVTNGCSRVMADTAFIGIKPLPTAYVAAITGPNPTYPGYYCASDSGVHIYLPSSDAGVSYQLWRGSVSVGSAVSGTGSNIDFGLQVVAGSYTITASDPATTCMGNMAGSVAVHIIALPTVFNVTGGGGYCPGGNGVHIGLDATETGYYYDLMRGTAHSGKLYGTGAAIDFGLKDTVGSYTIIGNNQISECANNMFGNATVSVDDILTPNVTLRTFPDQNTGVAVWHIDSMRVYVTSGGSNPTYQWTVNGHIIPGATNASFANHVFYNRDSVACMVTASGPCGGNSTVKSATLRLITEGVNTLTASASDVKLIPNPNKGSFALKGNTGASTTEELTAEVTNMLGQVVYSGAITAQNGNIDEHITLSNLANGMYILTLRSGTQNTVFHFVVEK